MPSALSVGEIGEEIAHFIHLKCNNDQRDRYRDCDPNCIMSDRDVSVMYVQSRRGPIKSYISLRRPNWDCT